jgi:hypothetical protein
MPGQRGAALVVGLVMLTLISVMVASTFTSSRANTQAVGNMQFRDEAIAAANQAIEQVLSSPFTTSPDSETISVDIDQDDTVDYEVAFNTPTCVSATRIAGAEAPPSSASLGTIGSSSSDVYQTVWDLDANVQHLASGAQVRVHQGVRVLLSQVQYNAVCST